MRRYHWLAVVPALAMLGGVPFANRVHPFIFGLPFLLAWIVAWVVIISATMGFIYWLDRAHDIDGASAPPSRGQTPS